MAETATALLALWNVSRWVCRLHQLGNIESGAQLMVETTAQRFEAEARRAEVDPRSRRGHLLAERVRDASPLPWLRAQQEQGVEGDWLICVALDDADVDMRAVSGAPAYARLPAG
jgi:hypothetical protein